MTTLVRMHTDTDTDPHDFDLEELVYVEQTCVSLLFLLSL
jgi:hypothetical protein